MRIIDILTSPWAIQPEKLFEIREIYSTHLRGDKIDIKAIEAKIGEPLENTSDNYNLIGDIAVISTVGIAAKRMNLFLRISGGTSTQLIAEYFKDALGRSDIKGILHYIDSPGGTVDGTQELSNIIFEGRSIKPIISFTDGIMASAAYWFGSAAHEIYISGDTVDIGSIGVVAAHVDYSAYEKKIGIKTTEIYAGKYKRIASAYRPLSKEGKQSIQDQVDYIYSVFVDEIAKQRGVSSERVLTEMADGRIFIGKQAIDAGLVDGVATFDQAMERLTVLQSKMEREKELAELNNSIRRDS